MKRYAEYWNIGNCGGVGKTVSLINRYAEDNNVEIVGITYAYGDVIVVFEEADDEQRENV